MALPSVALILSLASLVFSIYVLVTVTTAHEWALVRGWVHRWARGHRTGPGLTYDNTATGGDRGVACTDCDWSYAERT